MTDGFDLSWMGWTWPTAIFFIAIGLIIAAMTIWQILSPSVERTGIVRIRTTRGDRCFISLLGGALIAMAWVGLVGQYYVGLGAIWLLFAFVVFRWF